MLILDKPRALDRMLYLSDRKGNAVPSEFLRSAPLRWTATATGGRTLAREVVLRPATPALWPAPAPRDRELPLVIPPRFGYAASRAVHHSTKRGILNEPQAG